MNASAATWLHATHGCHDLKYSVQQDSKQEAASALVGRSHTGVLCPAEAILLGSLGRSVDCEFRLFSLFGSRCLDLAGSLSYFFGCVRGATPPNTRRKMGETKHENKETKTKLIAMMGNGKMGDGRTARTRTEKEAHQVKHTKASRATVKLSAAQPYQVPVRE